MGTTLTGTTPQDTYDSLIKVTDNGPIGATPKYLSDGLGTDSSLALSTKNILIGTTTAVVNYGRELTVDATALTSEPEAFLALKGNRVSGNIAAVPFYNGAQQVGSITMQAEGNMRLLTGTTTANTSEKVRITADGKVGIGTTSPIGKLHIEGVSSGQGIRFNHSASNSFIFSTISNGNPIAFDNLSGDLAIYTGGAERIRVLSSGGLTFNGDTAAANALDDYEEGTWTMGVSFGGGSTGITYSNRTGRYTKVGNMVTVVGYIEMSNKGTSFDAARVTGLPFTIGSGNTNYSSPSLRLNKITFANQYTGFGEPNNTTILLVEQTEAGVETTLNDTNFANNSEVILTYTYFV